MAQKLANAWLSIWLIVIAIIAIALAVIFSCQLVQLDIGCMPFGVHNYCACASCF
ncbi:MAG: hypothetical protein LBJ12_05295 [Oscillospiraceae bacterium]|nr:hypothetical protein [Oscillospiraceae bacterium]